MAGTKNMKITSSVGTFDAKLENLCGKAEPRKVNGQEIVMKTDGSPKIIHKDFTGKEVTFCRLMNGKPLTDANGKVVPLSNGYVDEAGNPVTETVPHYLTADGKHIQAVKNDKTEVFEVKKWVPIKEFTDKYIVDKF